jgi:hypothetical protein
MSRLFTSDFELNDRALEGWTVLDGTSAWATITSTSPLKGLYSMRILAAGTGGVRWQRQFLSADTGLTTFYRWYMYFASLPTSPGVELITVLNTALTTYVVVWLDNTGSVKLQTLATQSGGTTATLSASTLYRVELGVTISAPSWVTTLRIFSGDSVTPIEQIGPFFVNTAGAVGVANILLGPFSGGSLPAQSGWDVRYDSIAINDTAGTLENTWVGPYSPLTPAIWNWYSGVK